MPAAARNLEKTGYTIEDAYRDFYVRSRNEKYTGETEGFQFHNGLCKVVGLPKGVRCEKSAEDCAISDDSCRVHDRVQHLNALLNYPYTYSEERGGRRVPVTVPSYTVLTQEEYDGADEDGSPPEDF